MSCANHLVVFARYPRLGTGKKRLARDIGPVQALRFQRVMLAHTLRRVGRDRRWVTWLAVTPGRSGPWPGGIRVMPQGEGDLGRRMARVARTLPPGPVVIIGSDIPGVTSRGVALAFSALGRSDAVFGPAPDGGYWLAGLRRRPHFIDPFRDVRWSSEYALADTMANLAGRKTTLVERLGDVDDGASLSRHPCWEVYHARRRP